MVCMPWFLWICNRVNICKYLDCILVSTIYWNIVWCKVIELTNLCILCWRCWVRVRITCCKYPALICISYCTVTHCNIGTKTTICRCWLKSECHINMIHYCIFKENVLNTITCVASCCKSAVTFTKEVIKHPYFWVSLNLWISCTHTNWSTET